MRDLMLVPIRIVDPFRGIQCVSGVGGQRKAPWFVYVPAKTDNHDTFPVLWHTIIRGVDFLENHTVAEPKLHSSRMVLLQPRQVFRPSFGFAADELRILKLQEHIAEIPGKRFSKQSADILENKSFWPGGSHYVHGMREHVAFITVSLVFAPNGKRLAWRAARNEFHLVLPFVKLNVADVLAIKPQIVPHPAMPVLRQGLTGIMIAFNHRNRPESRLMKAERKSPTTGK